MCSMTFAAGGTKIKVKNFSGQFPFGIHKSKIGKAF